VTKDQRREDPILVEESGWDRAAGEEFGRTAQLCGTTLSFIRDMIVPNFRGEGTYPAQGVCPCKTKEPDTCPPSKTSVAADDRQPPLSPLQ